VVSWQCCTFSPQGPDSYLGDVMVCEQSHFLPPASEGTHCHDSLVRATTAQVFPFLKNEKELKKKIIISSFLFIHKFSSNNIQAPDEASNGYRTSLVEFQPIQFSFLNKML
jgi:hypothetical protein